MKGKRLNRGRMARGLVLYCIAVLTLTGVWAMVVKTSSTSADLTDVLTFMGLAFGGELLLLLVKRVLAKPGDRAEE